METTTLSVTGSCYEPEGTEPREVIFGEPPEFWDYGVICDHDDNYACDHRLKALKEKYAIKE